MSSRNIISCYCIIIGIILYLQFFQNYARHYIFLVEFQTFFCFFVPNPKARSIMKQLSRESRTWAQIFTFSFFLSFFFSFADTIFFKWLVFQHSTIFVCKEEFASLFLPVIICSAKRWNMSKAGLCTETFKCNLEHKTVLFKYSFLKQVMMTGCQRISLYASFSCYFCSKTNGRLYSNYYATYLVFLLSFLGQNFFSLSSYSALGNKLLSSNFLSWKLNRCSVNSITPSTFFH